MPAVAAAQGTQPSPGGTGGSANSNTQTGTIGKGANAGAGGNAGNQACLIQQNAGRDANAACNQTQTFNSSRTVSPSVGARSRGVRSSGVTALRSSGVRLAGVTGVSGVRSVTLPRTGFDAWVLALLGGVAVAGGLGLLAAQRRGRLSV